MYSLLFRNRWFALGWMALTIFAVVTFFARDGGHTMLEEATDEIRSSNGTILGPGVSGRRDRGSFAADPPAARFGEAPEEYAMDDTAPSDTR